MNLVNECKEITMLFAETRKLIDDWEALNQNQ
jgi:hypothetical protein